MPMGSLGWVLTFRPRLEADTPTGIVPLWATLGTWGTTAAGCGDWKPGIGALAGGAAGCAKLASGRAGIGAGTVG